MYRNSTNIFRKIVKNLTAVNVLYLLFMLVMDYDTKVPKYTNQYLLVTYFMLLKDSVELYVYTDFFC